jgi:hypothetical protein
VYALRDEFFPGTWLAGDEDAQVEARGNRDILPDLPHQLGLTDESVYHWRAVYISLPCSIRTQPSPGQEFDAIRGQMSGVFKLAYDRAVHRITESHDKMGLSAFDVDVEFTNSPGASASAWKFELALQT